MASLVFLRAAPGYPLAYPEDAFFCTRESLLLTLVVELVELLCTLLDLLDLRAPVPVAEHVLLLCLGLRDSWLRISHTH